MRPTLIVLQNIVDAALSRPASLGDARAARDNRRPTFRSLDQVSRADGRATGVAMPYTSLFCKTAKSPRCYAKPTQVGCRLSLKPVSTGLVYQQRISIRASAITHNYRGFSSIKHWSSYFSQDHVYYRKLISGPEVWNDTRGPFSV